MHAHKESEMKCQLITLIFNPYFGLLRTGFAEIFLSYFEIFNRKHARMLKSPTVVIETLRLATSLDLKVSRLCLGGPKHTDT